MAARAPARRRVRHAVRIAALLGVALLGTAAVVALRGDAASIVWLTPASLPIEARGTSSERFTADLADRARKLFDEATQLDELESEPLPPAIEVANGFDAAASRIARRLVGLADRSIVIEVTFVPDHAEVLVHERERRETLRRRSERATASLDRLASDAAEELVTLVAPASAATLAFADPATLGDPARLDAILASIARHPALARDARGIALRAAYDAAQGRCVVALGALEPLLARRPNAARLQLVAAECDARRGRRERALERLALASDHATDATTLALAGAAHVPLGYPQRALERLRVAHQRDPGATLTRMLIGETLIALHRPEEALDWLRFDPGPRWRERALAARGLAQARSGDGPGATATAAALRQAYPATVAALRIEGELALATRAWPQALGRFGALRMLAPRDGHAHAGEGAAWVGLRRPVEAVESYRTCRDIAPWLAECALGLGVALREADDADQALEALHDAEQLDAIDPRIPFEIARTLRALVRRTEATEYAARAEIARRRLEQKLPLP